MVKIVTFVVTFLSLMSLIFTYVTTSFYMWEVLHLWDFFTFDGLTDATTSPDSYVNTNAYVILV